MRNRLEQRIAQLKRNFLELERCKLTKKTESDVRATLQLLDGLEAIERQGTGIRKALDELTTSLTIKYNQARQDIRQWKRSTRKPNQPGKSSVAHE